MCTKRLTSVHWTDSDGNKGWTDQRPHLAVTRRNRLPEKFASRRRPPLQGLSRKDHMVERLPIFSSVRRTTTQRPTRLHPSANMPLDQAGAGGARLQEIETPGKVDGPLVLQRAVVARPPSLRRPLRSTIAHFGAHGLAEASRCRWGLASSVRGRQQVKREVTNRNQTLF